MNLRRSRRHGRPQARRAGDLPGQRHLADHVAFWDARCLLNRRLNARGAEPVAFDSDCRGICWQCIDRSPVTHGPKEYHVPVAHAQLQDSGRSPSSRGAPMPSRRGRLVVDRSAFDQSSRRAGSSRSTPALRPTRTPRPCRSRRRTRPSLAAECIGCGACVAACPNAAAMLFMGAKITHLGGELLGAAGAGDAVSGDGCPSTTRKVSAGAQYR